MNDSLSEPLRRHPAPAARPWWEDAVVYHVYPRSFQDSGGDGVGDLPGLRRRLGYLSWLGVDALWLSPVYRSPMRDFGYDVADHTVIDPTFGTLRDIDGVIADAHRLGMRVLLDFVPNHTSDEHHWFKAARRDAETRDFYVWRDPAPDGGPPNNWIGVFGGSAWTLDDLTGQYYLHSFLASQPDLNWRTRMSSGRCSTCCATGSTAASTGSGSTPRNTSSRIRSCATTHRRRWRSGDGAARVRPTAARARPRAGGRARALSPDAPAARQRARRAAPGAGRGARAS